MVISYELLSRMFRNEDFNILDWQPLVTFGSSGNSRAPRFLNAPISLHIENIGLPKVCRCHPDIESQFREHYFCSELLQWRDLKKDAPMLINYYQNLGITLVPTHFSYACIIQKRYHIEYDIDHELLTKVFQLPTLTMTKLAKRTISSAAVDTRLRFGLRYSDSYPAIANVLQQISNEICLKRLDNTRKKQP